MSKKLALFPLLLVLYEIIVYLSNDMYVPALPSIMHDLFTTSHLTQLSVTTCFLGAVSMQLVLGPLSDRYGRKPILFGGAIVFVISTLICAFAPHIMTLLVARFFQGTAVCSISVAGYAAIHEMYETKQAIQTIATMNSITVLAPAVGPLLGSLVLLFGNWRNIFELLAVLAIVVLICLFRKMPETHAHSQRHPLKLRLVLTNYASLFCNITFLRHTLIFCLLFSAMIAWIAAGPFLITLTYHQPPYVFGLAQVFVFGAFIAGAHIAGRLIHTISPHRIVHHGLIYACVGGILSAILAYCFSFFLIGFVLSLMLFTHGAGRGFAVLSRQAIEASQQPMGTTMAVFSTIMSGFGVLGSAFISGFYNGTLLSLAAFFAGVGIIAYLLHQTDRTRTETCHDTAK